MTQILVYAFMLLILVYAIILGRDLFINRARLKEEKGNPFAIALATACIHFLSTFGLSDFNLSIPLYRGAKWVEDERLPGTLFNAAVIPGAMIAILYISSTAVEIPTLLGCIVAQSLGAVIGGRIVSRMQGENIKKAMAIALLASVAVIVIRTLTAGAEGGSLTGFGAATLMWLIPVYVLFGIINTLGFGVKALSMALLLTLGLRADCVLPVVIGACGFGACCGAVQFIKKDRYQRKIALIASTAGVCGVLIGATFVKGLPTDILQWVMVAVMLYTAVTMLRKKA